MRRLWIGLALWLALALPGAAQDISPPDGARLTGSAAPITLRWKGAEPEYRVEVLAGQARIFSEVVRGNAVTLPLRPGPLYRWKVSPGQQGLFRDSGQFYSFQYSEALEYRFQGQPGRPGRNGFEPGASGEPGGPGGPGGEVLVELFKVGDFIRVTLQNGRNVSQLWLVPGSQPLRILAGGGPGGNGGAGAPGRAGWSNARAYPDPNVRIQPAYTFTPPGNGGNGGDGGDGGPGGTVTVKAGPGLEPQALVQAVVTGGPGGLAGPPGPGGEPAPSYGTGWTGPPGVPGQPGRPGRAGPAGLVR